jgi:hypothetical protein
VYPKTLQASPGARQQACSFFVFPDGKVGRRSPDAIVPACDSTYRARWRPTTRALSLAQQMTIDVRCPTTWTATGGPVSPTGVYTPGRTLGDFRLVGSSAIGPCLVADTVGVVHRRWRVLYLAGGVIRFVIDSTGEWNTVADLLARRLEPAPEGASPRLAWSEH